MIYPFLILILIISIKGIFAAADTSFTYINRAEIKQLSKKDEKARKIRILMEDTNKFFGIIEVGLNMCELLASAVVSLTFIEQLADTLETKMSVEMAMLLSVLVVTIILSYFLLVFGAVLPKRIARNSPKKVAYKIIHILWVIAKLNQPFEKIIDYSTNFFSRIFDINVELNEKMTEKQLKMIIREAKDEGIIANTEKNILIKTVNVNNLPVYKIMISMENVGIINIKNSINTILKNIQKNKYTRIPVYEKDKANIIGVLNVKEMAVKYIQNGVKNTEQIKKILKEPQYIKKEEKILTVFKKMQKNNQLMGIVINEENIPIGIVTMEDILEKLVGKIFDEDDKKDT